jgi:predicted transcriptional regulator
VVKQALTLTTEDRFGVFADRHRGSSKFNTARRDYTILDLVSRHEGLTAKALARELGVSLSTCYCLINILVEEGFVEKIAYRKGYKLGPAVSLLYSRARKLDVDSGVEPVVEELAAPIRLGGCPGANFRQCAKTARALFVFCSVF